MTLLMQNFLNINYLLIPSLKTNTMQKSIKFIINQFLNIVQIYITANAQYIQYLKAIKLVLEYKSYNSCALFCYFHIFCFFRNPMSRWTFFSHSLDFCYHLNNYLFIFLYLCCWNSLVLPTHIQERRYGILNDPKI